jgi:putative endonuclease
MSGKPGKASTVNPNPDLWFVYILYNMGSGRTYTGITKDPHKRLEKHNSGEGAKNTRAGKGLWYMAYVKRYPNKSEASKEEARIKKLNRKTKLLMCRISC